MKISVKVVPRSGRNAVTGWVGDAVKVCVTAAPERGKANAAVVEVLAEALGVPKAAVQIMAGATSARKIVQVEGLDAAEARRRLAEIAST